MALQNNVARDGVSRLIKRAYTMRESGTGSLVAAVAGKRIKVLRLIVSASNAVSVTILSGTDNIMKLYFTSAHRIANLVASDGVCVCKTDVGEALNITVNIGGVPTYFYVQYVLVN